MRVDLSKGGHRRIPRDERVRFAPVHILPCTYECTALRKETAALASPLLLSEFPSALLCPQKTRRSSRIVLRLRKKNTYLESRTPGPARSATDAFGYQSHAFATTYSYGASPLGSGSPKYMCTNARFMVPLLPPPRHQTSIPERSVQLHTQLVLNMQIAPSLFVVRRLGPRISTPARRSRDVDRLLPRAAVA